jgi:acetyl/propionyl-CoA carboxylase alpha subunit
MALDIAHLFNYRNVGSVEFLMDEHGQFYFTEIKARIQMEHPVTEMVSQVDLVSAQIRIAANEPLTLKQENVQLRGSAMQCRINAEDPWRAYMPSPGHIQRLRLPAGPHVRVDTYAYSGCEVPARYDPVLAKVIVWGEDRDECARRMRRALEDFTAIGIPTNLPLHQRALSTPAFIQGEYTTDFFRHVIGGGEVSETYLRDLAVAAAIAYAQRNLAFHPSSPERMQSGWHRASRELPRW